MRLLGAVLIFARVDAAAPPSNAATRRALRELIDRGDAEASGDGLAADRSTPESPAGDRRGFSLTAAGLPRWSDMDGTGTDRLHSLFCPLQMISQICWRSKPVPILLWLLGVPLSVVIVLWLVNVI